MMELRKIGERADRGTPDERARAMAELSTPEGMERWAEAMREKARVNFDSDGYLLPTFMVLGHDGISIIAAPDSMQSEETKDQMAEWIRGFAQEQHARAVIFISEAWMLTLEPGHTGPLPKPSESAKRQERAILTLDTKLTLKMWSIPIDRSGDAPFLRGEWEEMPGTSRGGRFSDILDGSAIEEAEPS